MTDMILTVLTVGVQAALVILAVDFASGILHWLEDSYGKTSWPVVGRWIIAPNVRHHFQPRAFTKSTFWKRNLVTMVIAGLVLVVVLALGWFDWKWALACGLGAICNEIHCWAHRSPRENGRVITLLQKTGVIQSPRAHAVHHTDPKDRSYCTVTDYLNPLLDRIRFFERLEGGIRFLFGVERRKDESVRPQRPHHRRGPDPDPCSGRCGAKCAGCSLRREQRGSARELARAD